MVLAPVSFSLVKSATFISSLSMPGFSSQISVLLSFPVYCRSFQNLMFFLIKLLICCEHIAFQVSLQLAKQIKFLNPLLQSVLSCPQNILWLFFLHSHTFYHSSNVCGWPQHSHLQKTKSPSCPSPLLCSYI